MVLLQKLTARVFGASRGIGGNPVTIFLPKGTNELLPPALEQSLAKSCEWESVLIQKSTSTSLLSATTTTTATTTTVPHQFKFFVPSGNELAFCAHAAMGAAYAIHHNHNHNNNNQSTGDAHTQNHTVAFRTGGSGDRPKTAHIARNNDDTVFLDLDYVSYDESSLALVHTESLLDQLGLEMMHVLNLPMNVAVAGRPKTLVQVPLAVLQEQTQAAPVSATAFRDNCFLAKESTGLYLYAERNNSDNHNSDNNAGSVIELECRQFPSDSGYPEDPATGIAAAALAVRLAKRRQPTNEQIYHISQGTAMGRPSRITIQNINFHTTTTPTSKSPDENEKRQSSTTVSLQCGGRVEIDAIEEIRM